MAEIGRSVKPSFGELVDRLAINQLKQLKRPASLTAYGDELRRIERDLSSLCESAGRLLDPMTVRLTIALAQVNVHIWNAKEDMQSDTALFATSMKVAHQLNGTRNQLKNRLSARLASVGDVIPSNTSSEDLSGWRFSVLERDGGAAE